MGGKIVLVPEAAHVCQGIPPSSLYPQATQWQCDECAQTWVLVYGSQYNEHYEVWRRMTLQNVDGRDL